MPDREPTGIALKLKSLLVGEIEKLLDFRTLFWFSLAILSAFAFGLRALGQAFSSEYILQDDWRHHVFWMARLVDPSLFPNDLIADYFQSVAPIGYVTLYKLAASLGLHPYVFARVLPLALGVITAAFCFKASMKLLRVPFAGFLASFLLNQSLWMRNGLVSATPRAFIAPLLIAFLYFQLCDSIAFTLLTIALMGLFFPSTMFIAIGVVCLRIFRFERWRIKFSPNRRDYYFCIASLVVGAAVLLPYAFRSSGFGPVVSASEGRLMPEFLPGGRMVVFRQNSFGYWITGNHTGMFTSAVFAPAAMCLGLLLPVLLLLKKRFTLAQAVGERAGLLGRILLASIVIFFAANLLLFRLYLPSRFTTNSFRIVLALAAGLSATMILEALFKYAGSMVALSGAAFLAFILLVPFATGTVIDTRYKTGDAPDLYRYLQQQPTNIVVASLSDEANNLPIFAQRSVLVSRETALPFHKRYYSQIRERTINMIQAQYSPDLSQLQAFIRKYGVTFILVDENAFTPEYVRKDKWLAQYQPATQEAVAALRRGDVPALSKLPAECSVLNTDNMSLISAECILKQAN